MEHQLKPRESADPAREEIVVLAPTGQDASLIAAALAGESSPTRVVADIEGACLALERGTVATLIVAEEALTPTGIKLLNETLLKQEPWSDIPIILMTSSGETSLVTLRVMKAFSPAGNLNLIERPFRRITLQSVVQVALRARRRQHEVRELIERQKEATRVRDEFISIASHELKTPLTSLKLQAQLSQRRISAGDLTVFDPARTQKLVESTAKQVDRLARLVEDMLDISRINSGKLVIQREPFDLAELVQEAVERIQPQCEQAGCEIAVRVEEGLNGSWDRYRIEQVINNLLTNATRYCPGAPIEVEARRERAAGREGASAVVTVKDYGKGIAAGDQARIFNRFERAVSAKNISGLGLGLFICREIVEAHEGTISVQSELGKGSTFVIRLPL